MCAGRLRCGTGIAIDATTADRPWDAVDYLRRNLLYSDTTRSGHVVEPTELAHHLLNLRKRGEDNGGLPRLQRRYNGR